MENVIQTNSLTKVYGKSTALNDVSLTLNKGDIYGLIGKNGAGKTTLFKLIMGLSNPNKGDVDFNLEMGNAQNKIGFMMGSCFFPYFNAYQNLEFFRNVKGIKDKNEIDRVLEMVELTGVKKKFSAFSMGMKQRLGIANALMGNPSVVILDEPINGLDPQGISDIRQMIQRLNKEHGITFIISSHILGELDIMATRFGFIHNGRIIEELEQDELNDKMTTSLIVKVDDLKKGCQVIEQILKTTKYKVIEDNEIVLNEYLDSPEIVAEAMFKYGLKLYKLHNEETTLENYFLNLIGGIENA